MDAISLNQQNQIKTICDAIPHMSEFDKGYFIGKAEEAIRNAKEEKKHDISG